MARICADAGYIQLIYNFTMGRRKLLKSPAVFNRSVLIPAILVVLGGSALAGTISTVAGTGAAGFNSDGITAVTAKLNGPYGVWVDGSGTLFIADYSNNRVRKVEATTGMISTVAGTGVGGYDFDGVDATTARLNLPTGVYTDTSGNLFISDFWNNRIRRVDVVMGFISTIGGTGLTPYNGDGIPATTANIYQPFSVHGDPAGNIYVAAFGSERVRRIDAGSGNISTPAGTGTGGYNGDGIPATGAKLNSPWGVFKDLAGNVYIGDTNNHRVRKIDAVSGLISTVAGTGVAGYNGDGISAVTAKINGPMGIFVTPAGDIYIAEFYGHRIRRVDAATGLISTVAGTGVGGYNGDGIAATTAQLKAPSGVVVDATGSLYISDFNNHRVRKVSVNPPASPSGPAGPSTACASASCSFSASTTDPDGDLVKYGWDWNGDGVVDEWSALMASGTMDTRSHLWALPGTYPVKVKAEDSNGDLSGWSPATSVDILPATPVTILLSKKVVPAVPAPGEAVLYSISVTNNSLATITDLVISDTLPAEIAYVGESSPAGMVPDFTAGLASWAGHGMAIPPSSSITVTIYATVAVCHDGLVSNTAWAYASTFCSGMQAAKGESFSVTRPTLGVSLPQYLFPSNPVNGMPVNFRIVAVNTGSSTVESILIVDTLPPEITYSGEDHPVIPGFSFAINGQIASWSGPVTIYPGASLTVTLTGMAAACYSGGVSNTAWIIAADVCGSIEAKSLAGYQVAKPSLSVSLQAHRSPSSPGNGMQVSYRLVASNTGSATVSGIAISDTLPAQVAFSGESHPAIPGLSFSLLGQVASWSGVFPLAPGTSLTVTLTGTTSSCYTGKVTNTAWVYAEDACDSVQGKSVDEFPLAPLSAALAVQTALVSNPVQGGALVYRITVTNSSSGTITDLLIVDSLPPSVAYVSEVHPAGILSFSRAGNLLSWSGSGLSIPPLGSLTVTATGTAPACFIGGISNTAYSLAGNGCSAAQASSGVVADLSGLALGAAVQRYLIPLNPVNGGAVKFLIVVSNTGSATIGDIAITDTLANEIDFIAEDHAQVPGLVFSQAGKLVSWTGSLLLGSGRQFTVTVTGKVADCFAGTVAGRTWIHAGNSCGKAEKQASNTFILAPLSISVAKSAITAEIKPKGPLSYRIVVSNTSRMTLTGVVIVDTLPADFIFTAEQHPSFLSFSSAGKVLSWGGDPVTLPPGMAFSITVSGTISAQCRGKVSNTALAAAWNACGSVGGADDVVLDVRYEGPVRVFPNPFNPGKAVGGLLKFEGVPDGAKIRIYSVDGLMVWEATSSGGVTGWNGRDDRGGRVSKGLYIWTAEKSGSVKTGKLILE
jgi:uncharacterized repeat protein (TIGR01451 family)